KTAPRRAAAREDRGTILGGRASDLDALPLAWNAPRPREQEPEPLAPASPPPPPAPVSRPAPPSAAARAVAADVDPLDVTVAPAPPAAPAPPFAPPSAAAPRAELPLDRFPLERCAAIAASIDRAPAERGAVLESNEIDAPTWQALEAHHRGALARETSSRKPLLKRYDEAYVARLEEERGPISAEEYARVVAAVERGDAAATMRELGLPAAALIRLERVWLRKVVDDPKLGKAVSRALKAARDA
ncbi:MAG TPA: hypothetical protein VHB21_10210, partial [Minicystis sp.]|nr:hypothetical protein [Minicystis sp.]